MFFEDRQVLDIERLLRGQIHILPSNRVLAANPLARTECEITLADLQVLARVPSNEWLAISQLATRSGVDRSQVEELVRTGLLLSDAEDSQAAALREGDEKLESIPWERFAALYHHMAKWEDVNPKGDSWDPLSREYLEQLVEEFGPPPGHFHRLPQPVDRVDLPEVAETSSFSRLLLERATVRRFDRARPLELREASILLKQAFGAHGLARFTEGVVGLRKTSPSGGALHPIEVYPIVLRVSGLTPGLYHYSVGDHALEPVTSASTSELEDLVTEFTAGQLYASSAAMLLVFTARFARSFWKYREHKKAYKVILMDAGHLSQTFYLLCADMGLGAFFTGAINDVNIERHLGLDGLEESPLGICGCGHPGAGDDMALARWFDRP